MSLLKKSSRWEIVRPKALASAYGRSTLPLDCRSTGVRLVLDLQPVVSEARTVRRVRPLLDDALVVVVYDCFEKRFTVRLDVLEDLYTPQGLDVLMK